MMDIKFLNNTYCGLKKQRDIVINEQQKLHLAKMREENIDPLNVGKYTIYIYIYESYWGTGICL